MQERESSREEPLDETEDTAICSQELLAEMRERIAKGKKPGKRSGPDESRGELENPS